MFLSKNKKNIVYPCKPQFYYIKVGFKGVKVVSACFRDGHCLFLIFLLLSVPRKGCASLPWHFLGSYLYFSFSSVALMPFPKTNQVSIVLSCNNASFLIVLHFCTCKKY